MQTALRRDNNLSVSAAWARYSAIFAAAFFMLFLGSSRYLIVYDEGITLTNTMRVLAGQVIHRDFYYNYGPAPIYALAGLFKMFGPSVLVDRLFWLSGDALLVVSVYAITRQVSRETIARTAMVLAFMWVFATSVHTLLMVAILWSTWLLVRAFESDLPAGRGFAAGLLVGVAVLFRYDMGAGCLACHLLILAIASGLRVSKLRSWCSSMARSLWGYGLGLAIVVLPLTWIYMRAGVIHDLLFDIVIYTARHYRVGRGLPLPRPQIKQMQDLVVYVVAVLILVAFYVAVRYLLRQRRSGVAWVVPQWIGLLISFGIVATMLYAKGILRIYAGAVEMPAMLCLVTTAALWERRDLLEPGLRQLIKGAVVLFAFLTLWGDLHPISSEHKFKSSMLMWFIVPGKMAPEPPFQRWCQDQTPITRGVCYVLDDDHIQTVEFLKAHTHSGDTLYVGLPQHDRVLVDDNITYFATQRLPATKWSHFDPFLQNSAPIQREMISDLERNKPPYLALDSEFDKVHEPNGSSVHTGVHLLDDYIAQHYRLVKTFGEMTVLQRIPDTLTGEPLKLD